MNAKAKQGRTTKNALLVLPGRFWKIKKILTQKLKKTARGKISNRIRKCTQNILGARVAIHFAAG